MVWYNSSWTKRKPITLLGGASGAQSAYQVKLTVTWDSDMAADFSDLRFTESDGETLLDSWLESHVASTSAIVWVETDTPANTVEADIYCYYGNSGASSAWDCQATMLDGDDFTGSSLDTAIWDSQYCNTAVSGGKLTINAFSGGARYEGGIKGKVAIPPSCIIEAKIKQLNTAADCYVGLMEFFNWHLVSCDMQWMGFLYTNKLYGWNRNDSSQSLLNTTGLTVVQEYKYKIVNNGSNIAYTYDGTAISGSPQTSNLPNENMYLRVSGDNTHPATVEIDWIFARKYAANPATYVFGTEEWDNASWPKCKTITLTGGTSGAQTDYQVKLAVAYDSDMKSDFSDLRFTKADNTTLLDAWLESKTDSVSATVWVKTDTPASTVESDIYMYYGNSGASSDWDGSATFPFFDDFSAGNFNKWSTAGSPTISSEIATVNAASEGILGDTGYGIGYSWRSRYNCNITQGTGSSEEGWNNTVISTDSPYEAFNAFTSSPYRRTLQSGAPVTSNLDASYLGSYHVYEVMRGGTASTLFSIDDVLKRTSTASSTGTLYPNYMMYASGGQIDVDWSLVRKYVTNPATYEFGAEGWYNSNWTKRKPITLTGGASGAQSDYQVKLTVTYDSDMKSDFSDLRFTKSDGATLLNAWLESYTASTSAIVWVETNTPAGTVEADIYMYYGNSGASSDWDIGATFIFGDDCDDGAVDTDKWNVTGANVAESSGTLQITGTNSWNGNGITSKTTLDRTNGLILEWENSLSALVHSYEGYGVQPLNTAGSGVHFRRDNDGKLLRAKDGNLLEVGTYTTAKTRQKLILLPSAGYEIYFDGVLEDSDAAWATDDNRLAYQVYTNNQTMYLDFCFARKYATNPATYEFGSEETNWYNASWTKRKPITLTGGASGAQSDYQVKLTVTYDSDMKSDFSDLRFTKMDGTTLLDAWMESYTASTSAIVWVETNTPANTVETDIYMYYGNSGASSDWDLPNTFLGGTDYKQDDGFTIYDNGTSESFGNSVGEIRTNNDELTISSADRAHVNYVEKAITAISDNFAVRARVKVDTVSNTDVGYDYTLCTIEEDSGEQVWGGSNKVISLVQAGDDGFKIKEHRNAGYGGATALITKSFNTWHIVEMRITGTTATLDVGGTTQSCTITNDTRNYLKGLNYWSAVSSRTWTAHEDWVLLRKYVANPATYEFGAEEENVPSVGRMMWKVNGGLLRGLVSGGLAR